MQNANEILGFLHGSYGFGAVLSPIIATTMVTKARLEWYIFYYILIGAAVFELAFAVTAFWTETGQKFRDANPRSNDKKGGRTKEALGNRVTWICSVFLLIYVGIEVALGGWVVVFMMEIRHATPFAAGVSATGFWVGITLGRIVLGFVTPKIGEKLAIFVSRRLSGLPNIVIRNSHSCLLSRYISPSPRSSTWSSTSSHPSQSRLQPSPLKGSSSDHSSPPQSSLPLRSSRNTSMLLPLVLQPPSGLVEHVSYHSRWEQSPRQRACRC